MSRESHYNPEKWYQESLDRIPVTDAYREEQREFAAEQEEEEEELGNNGEPLPPEVNEDGLEER